MKKTTKKKKNPKTSSIESLQERMMHQLQQALTKPISQKQLFASCQIDESEIPQAKSALSSLIAQNKVMIQKKMLSIPQKSEFMPSIVGTLSMHPKGFGFVTAQPSFSLEQDIFIPKHCTNGAVDGDTVEVILVPGLKPEKGPEGKIINIVKRGRSHLAGIVIFIDDRARAHAHIPLLGTQKPAEVVIPPSSTIQRGDRVILKVLDWGGKGKMPLCEITHHIGNINDASLDIIAAVEEFGIKNQFSQACMDQALAFGPEVKNEDLKGRQDLTQLETFTIDPQTAKDFDDALTLTVDKKGYHLIVHIADVAHYVTQDTPLDHEAFERGNSTYFPGRCIPMLPEELSNNLCSLKPDTLRLCMSVFISFDLHGDVTSTKIQRSFIRSQKRFTYEEAKQVIDGKLESPHRPTLKNMVELCLLLKKKRHARGSIDFALPEMVLEIDADGEPQGFNIVEYDITHQLVEEFMLKANEVVAKYLENKGKPLLYRVHDEPDVDAMLDFATMARSLGFFLPNTTTEAIQELFTKAKNSPFLPQLSVGFIRSMKLASYSAENVGHFGLALEHYCHFTSPIRRYSDLVIQRLVTDTQEDESNLELISLECSEKERLSFKAEMSVKTLKKLRLLKKYFDYNPNAVYLATISKVKPFGLYFELNGYMLDGFLHISELEEDYFLFDAISNSLTGEKTGMRHAIGDSISVKIRSIDFIVQECKWEILDAREPRSDSSKKKNTKKRKRFKKKQPKKNTSSRIDP